MKLLLDVGDWPIAAWRDAFERELGADHVVVTSDQIAPSEVTYIATWRHRPGSLAAFGAAKAIFSLGAGVDHLIEDRQRPAVPMVRVIDPSLAARVGEWVALHALAHLRRYDLYAWQQRQRLWLDHDNQPVAADVSVGVLGLGAIGGHAARLLHAIGFAVHGWSRTRHSGLPFPAHVGVSGLKEMLACTDILVSLLPLTSATRGILCYPLFRQLRRDGPLGGPILLNAGRGALHHEADILRALDDGTLRAVTLDVFNEEPLPPDSPLWGHERVTITPHNAGPSEPALIAALVSARIRLFEQDGVTGPFVDREAGY